MQPQVDAAAAEFNEEHYIQSLEPYSLSQNDYCRIDNALPAARFFVTISTELSQ